MRFQPAGPKPERRLSPPEAERRRHMKFQPAGPKPERRLSPPEAERRRHMRFQPAGLSKSASDLQEGASGAISKLPSCGIGR